MKKIFTPLTILLFLQLPAQEGKLIRDAKGKAELSEVIQVDSCTASRLFLNARLFLATAFQRVRETSQIKDEKAAYVATKGSFPVSLKNGEGEEIAAKVYFTLVIQSKENMYRYTLNEFYFAYTEPSGITSYASFNDRMGIAMSPQQWQEVEQQAGAFFQTFVEDMKLQMANKDNSSKEELATFKKRKHANK